MTLLYCLHTRQKTQKSKKYTDGAVTVRLNTLGTQQTVELFNIDARGNATGAPLDSAQLPVAQGAVVNQEEIEFEGFLATDFRLAVSCAHAPPPKPAARAASKSASKSGAAFKAPGRRPAVPGPPIEQAPPPPWQQQPQQQQQQQQRWRPPPPPPCVREPPRQPHQQPPLQPRANVPERATAYNNGDSSGGCDGCDGGGGSSRSSSGGGVAGAHIQAHDAGQQKSRPRPLPPLPRAQLMQQEQRQQRARHPPSPLEERLQRQHQQQQARQKQKRQQMVTCRVSGRQEQHERRQRQRLDGDEGGQWQRGTDAESDAWWQQFCPPILAAVRSMDVAAAHAFWS